MFFPLNQKPKKKKKLVGSNVVSKLEKPVAGFFFVSPSGVAVGTLISKFRTRIKPLTPDNNKKKSRRAFSPEIVQIRNKSQLKYSHRVC